jgi:hypothetical protein
VVWNGKPTNPPSNRFTVGAATCAACGNPIGFRALSKEPNALPINKVGNIEPDFVVMNVWPEREKPVAPTHTPAPVAKRFIEGEDAFGRGNWNSAVAMYRSALDIATKGMDGVQGKDFYHRLEWLHDSQKITPDIKDWADHVRVEGNAALHDPEEFAEADAKALRFFTEMFLRYVFELPETVKEFRSKTKT